MSLPYDSATSGKQALEQTQKILAKFGVSRFGWMTDSESGELIVQFTYMNRNIQLKASYKGYASAWLKQNPHTYRMRHTKQQHEQRAFAQAQISVYSVLRDWIKGQITAIETGMLSFDEAFLGQILTDSGKTVFQEATEQSILPAIGDKI